MMNLHSSIMLYTNYDYDKSKIKMEAGIFLSSPEKTIANYHVENSFTKNDSHYIGMG